MDADGDFVVAWQSSGQDGSQYGIYARRYNAAGQALGGEFLVNEGATADHQAFASVAMDDAGNFVVAWRSADADNWGVYARRYNAAGQPRGDLFAVNQAVTGEQGPPAVAMDADGDFVVTWGTAPVHGGARGVAARRFTASGAASDEFVVQPDGLTVLRGTAVAAAGDGDFVVSWLDSTGVSARRYDAQGIPLSNRIQVSRAGVPVVAQLLSVSTDAAGERFVVAWHDALVGARTEIFARRFAPGPRVLAAAHEMSYAPGRLLFRLDRHADSGSFTAADIEIRNVDTGRVINPELLTSYTASSMTATATFAGPRGTALADGNYRLTLRGGGVTDLAGYPFAGDAVVDFFVLAGDVNRDRSVDGTDFALLAANFGKTAMTFGQGDLNGDERVDGADFSILATNFGRTVPAPAAPVAPAAVSVNSLSPPTKRPPRNVVRHLQRNARHPNLRRP
jgi:hypothetical protein